MFKIIISHLFSVIAQKCLLGSKNVVTCGCGDESSIVFGLE